MEMKMQSYRVAAKENRERLVQGLGWFSIGLGVMELVAPRTLANLIGVRPYAGLIRLLGVREVISGIGILTQPETAKWLKSRVAGDAMDLGLLGAARLTGNSDGARLAVAVTAVAGVTALDVVCSREYSERPNTGAILPGEQPGALRVRRSIIINRPAAHLYDVWHRFQDLPRFMSHLVSVQETGEHRSHWVARGPAGALVEWDAEITEDRPQEVIAWRSLENADVDQIGSVRFEPARGNRGTLVRVDLQYRPPGGKTGAAVARLFGKSPEQQIKVDLLRFKQLMETGEIARTEGQPAGRPRSTSRKYDDLVRA